MQEYTSKELNDIIGYVDVSGSNSSKEAIIRRCGNAGLKVEALPTKRGCPNKYIILKDNFHLDGETWVDCVFNTDWEVSNLGRIRKKGTKKLMGSANTDDNYMRVGTIDKTTGKPTNIGLNRAVFFSFNPELLNQEKNIQIDHINGIRTDNRLENLRPLTNVDNVQERDQHQKKIKTLTTDLILKYGYEQTEELLKQLL